MAAPLPHWKRKTRPCPFYSEGRCIFAESCNFVHTAKIDSRSSHQRRGDRIGWSTVPQYPLSSSSSIIHEPSSSYSQNEVAIGSEVDSDAHSMNSTVASTTPKGSGKRKSYRISLRSPPRSPRLSGLLSALQSVIGPDVEEVVEEVYEDEEAEDNAEDCSSSGSIAGGADGTGTLDNAVRLELGERAPILGEHVSPQFPNTSVASSSTSGLASPHSTSSTLPQDRADEIALEDGLERSPLSLEVSPLITRVDSSPAIASFDESPLSNAAPVLFSPVRAASSQEGSPSVTQFVTSPRPASTKSRRPPAIDTSYAFPVIAHAINSDGSSFANDDNALPTIDTSALSPLPSTAPKSPFELLSSPFASPDKRMLASLPFPSPGNRDSTSPILSPVFRNFSHAMVLEGLGPISPPRQRVSSLDSDLDSPATTEKHRTPTFEKRRSGSPVSASDTTQTPKPGPLDSKTYEGLPSPPTLTMPTQLDAAEFWVQAESREPVSSEASIEAEAPASLAYFDDVTSNHTSPTRQTDDIALTDADSSGSFEPTEVLSAKKHSYDSLDADDELAYAEADDMEETEEEYDEQSESSRVPSVVHSSVSTSLSLVESEGDAIASVMDFYSSDDPSPFSMENASSQTSELFDSDASGVDSVVPTNTSAVSSHSPIIAPQCSTESFTRSMTYAPVVHRPLSTSSSISVGMRPSSASSRLSGSRRTSAIITASHSPSPSHSASEAEPPSSSSSNLSWEEVSKNRAAGGSKRVSFGFRRQSLLLDTSTNALTPPTRLSRSVPTPAPRPASYNFGSKTLFSPRTHVQSPSPTSAESPQSASSAPGPSRPTSVRPSSWMKPLRLSQILDAPFGSDSTSRSQIKRFSRLSRNSRSSVTMTTQAHNVTSLGSPIDIHEHSSRPSTASEPSPPTRGISPVMLGNDGLHMRSLDAVLQSSLSMSEANEETIAPSNDIHDVDDTSDDGSRSVDLLSPLSGSMAGFVYDSGRSVRGSILVEHPEEEEEEDVIPGEAISEDPPEDYVPDSLQEPRLDAFIQPAVQRDLSPSPEPPTSAERTPAVITPSVSHSSVTPSSDVTTKLPPTPSIISPRAPSPSPPKASSPSLSPSHLAASNEPSLPSTSAVPPRARSPFHAIATPRPTLLFAIASDDPAAVERVLASGDAAPNDDVGPQSALEFAMKNESLTKKTEIVKVLLAYGADPTSVTGVGADTSGSGDVKGKGKEKEVAVEDVDGAVRDVESVVDVPKEDAGDMMNPAMKYYLSRAKAAQSAQSMAIRRSIYQPLARIRFDFVGQDRALEQLYTVLSMHSQQHMVNPLVVMCCGPSGHGKSLLARKFGSLLDVPAHTVNMTILQSSHDLWQCPSMSPYDAPSERTLAEFLTENQGKRCVVVLDEIDKNEDEKNLWSLLAPWELGRCSFDAGRRHIDVRNVIWIGTSNIGQDLIFEYDASRKNAEDPLTRQEFRELMALLRPKVTEKMGTALMSRVTTVLPFVPFTHDERLAIAAEALLALGGDAANALSPETFNHVVDAAVAEYVPLEGARSLYRSVSTHLMEVI